MKVIFLDIDGVLNTRNGPFVEPHDMLGVCEERVGILKKILSSTGAKIVISSSWRFSPMHMDILEDVFSVYDINVLCQTPDLRGEDRSIEIEEWLFNCDLDISKIAIIDDNEDAFVYNGWGRCNFKTNFNDGLTEEMASEISLFLNARAN